MESKKQTIVAILALIVSILSLLVSISVARRQYQEIIEVVAGPCYINDMDLESGIINGQAEVIVANTSYFTTSILRSKVLSSQPGFNPAIEIDSTLEAQLPITLIQGGAEKISFSFQFLLDDETIDKLKNGEDYASSLKGCFISIQFYSAKNHNYYASIRIKDAIISDTIN